MDPRISLKAIDYIVLLTLATCYGKLLESFLPMVYMQSEEPIPDIYKMLTTFTTATISTTIVFTLNIIILKQSMIKVGLFSALGALFWYYIVKGFPNFSLNVYISFQQGYSIFAVMAFSLIPIATGITLKTWFNYSGLKELVGNLIEEKNA